MEAGQETSLESMKNLIFIGLVTLLNGCNPTTNERNGATAPSAPVEKEYGDSARSPVLTDSVATDIR
jgi:hypothetical protein